MFTDHELLKLAAIAVGHGIEFTTDTDGRQRCWFENRFTCIAWEPLNNDGDALRLAVKLRIKFRYNEALGQALAWTGGYPDFEAKANIEDCGRDENACARRAIVRAAAEIGRQMQKGGK